MSEYDAMGNTEPPTECAVPECTKPRVPLILGWHGNDPITSAYCADHGPAEKATYCSECGNLKSSRRVWPDGVPPAGVVKGKVGTLAP